MSVRTLARIEMIAALGIAVGVSTVAFAQFNPFDQTMGMMRSMTDNWSAPTLVDKLASNEGILVDMKEFKIHKGALAKGDPAAHLTKAGAKEVTEGAIIFRSGDKLYIVDGKPAATKQ